MHSSSPSCRPLTDTLSCLFSYYYHSSSSNSSIRERERKEKESNPTESRGYNLTSVPKSGSPICDHGPGQRFIMFWRRNVHRPSVTLEPMALSPHTGVATFGNVPVERSQRSRLGVPRRCIGDSVTSCPGGASRRRSSQCDVSIQAVSGHVVTVTNLK